MRRLIVSILVLSILLSSTFSFSSPLELDGNSINATKDNLESLTQEEKRILEELFIILQEIKEMEEIEKATAIEIDDLKVEISNMEVLILEEENKYVENLSIMEVLLKSYQRNGANTYIELILGSDSLGTLLKRLNFMRDISRNTTELLEDLEKAKEMLLEDKESLNKTLKLVETRLEQQQLALEKKNELRGELENKLTSLHEDKERYEAYLKRLENSWAEIKPVFTETISMLVDIIQKGDLPEGTIVVTYGLSGIRGIIKEDGLGEILATHSFPTKIEILFSSDEIHLLMPDINIEMSGTLEILENKQSLRFNMNEGKYLGMKLEKSAMEELFSFGYLEFNFKSLLGKSTIKSIKINEDNIQLSINPILF